MGTPTSRSIRQALGVLNRHFDSAFTDAQKERSQSLPCDSAEAQEAVESCEAVIAKLQTRINSIMERDEQWTKIFDAISDETALDEESAHYETHATGSAGYISKVENAKDVIAVLKLKLKKIQLIAQPPVLNHTESGSSSPSPNGKFGKSSVRLPKMELPKFNGDVLKWRNFWALFENAVHSNNQISDVEKFTYLQSRLTGEALRAIDGIPINADGYNLALGILSSRFDQRPEQIITQLYRQLKLIPKSSDSVLDLQRTYDESEVIFRQLSDIGEDLSLNRSLSIDILNLYPTTIIREISMRRHVSDSEGSNLAACPVKELQEDIKLYLKQVTSLHGVVETLSSDSKYSSGNESQKTINNQGFLKSYSSTPRNQHGNNQQHSLTSALTASNHQKQLTCYFCNGQHYNNQCTAYATYDQRKKRLLSTNRCTRCLGNNHTSSNCRTPSKKIKCFHCRKQDHMSPMCPSRFSGVTENTVTMVAQTGKQPKTNKKRNESAKNTVAMLATEDTSILSTAIVTVRNPETKQHVQASLIFDNASSLTYTVEKIASQLQLKHSSRCQRLVNTFASREPLKTESKTATIEIIGRCGYIAIPLVVHTVPVITNCSVLPDNISQETKEALQSLDKQLAYDFNRHNSPPDILLGNDYFWSIITGAPFPVNRGIFCIPTKLGLIIGGSCTGSQSLVSVKSTLFSIAQKNAATYDSVIGGYTSINTNNIADIDEFWNLERIGIYDDPRDTADDEALKIFNDTISFKDGRYHVGWPWNENKLLLPSNYGLAFGRFRSLGTRLKETTPAIKEEYTKVINTQIESGIIEKVAAVELQSSNPTHYLSHHPIVRVSHTTTKLRIVYDASARIGKNALSLNQCVHRGPVILPDLCALLLRFRTNSIAIIADIEKAFLQLALRPEDRDVTRFFWFKDPVNPHPADFEVYRFCRVPFGVISSPFLLAATIQHHLKQQQQEVASVIAENIYVDNVIVTLENSAAAITFYDEAKTIFSKCAMNLREWRCNSSDVMEHIPKHHQSAGHINKVLGMRWNSQTDQLQLCGNWSKVDNCKTKRQLMCAIASIFDPTGIFQPVVVRLKILLRKLWLHKLDWESPLDSQLQQEWILLHREVAPIFQHQLPRQVIESFNSETATLIAFADASENAYAASIYIRAPISASRWATRLLFGKSRLSPNKFAQNKKLASSQVTLPKLELLALLIATRMAKFVKSALNLHESAIIYLFSDNTCVLSWIRSNKTLPVFIKNRVKEIKQLKNGEFRHVSSEDNAADVCSRGTSGTELLQNQLWWQGPSWLELNVSEWPQSSDIAPITSEELRYVTTKSKEPSVLQSFLSAEGPVEAPFSIDHRHFSSLRKLIRATCFCLKFVKKLWDRLPAERKAAKPKLDRLMDHESSPNVITASEIQKAKQIWIKYVQKVHLSDVLSALTNQKSHQLVNQLNLRIDDDGIIRCGGRLKFADLPFETIEPILLPAKDNFTRIIIEDVHQKLYHSGTSHTLSQLRRIYWVPKGRSIVRNVLRNCLVCKRVKGAPYALPRMPALPPERVAKSLPFEYCGVDYIGPINVRMRDFTQKHWIALFTCFTTRAVHLECVSDCTAQSFINALSRFIARRGAPAQMLSDNAPQFRLAKTLLDRTWQLVFNDRAVLSYISEKGITWKHIIELAPWQGGMYERLVGVVKNLFKAEVRRKLLQHDEFITLITEIESIVNSRPITYVNEDINSSYAIRPVDFLSSPSTGTPNIDSTLKPEGGDASKYLIKHWKFKQRRLDEPWKLWYQDYILSLREKHQMEHRKQRNHIKCVPSVDEVVIVKSEDLPRGCWKLGRVRKLIAGNDGKIRAAEVLLGNRQVVKRTINQLYPLEMKQITASNGREPSFESSNDEDFDGFDEEDVAEAIKTLESCNSAIILESATKSILLSLSFPVI